MAIRSAHSRGSERIPCIVAHRGAAAERPENTLAAFRRALEAGADGIECDVQLTRDGEVVVIHDERLERTTDGTGWVRDHTLRELQVLDAGGWFGRRYRGERIPTLHEVLAAAAGRARLINVELKNTRLRYPGLEARVLRLLHRFGVLGTTVVSSFNHASLRRIRDLEPRARIGMLPRALRAPVARALRLGAEALHPARTEVTARLVRGAHAAGLRVRVWTVNSAEELRRMRAWGVDAVFTDDPAAMVRAVRRGLARQGRAWRSSGRAP